MPDSRQVGADRCFVSGERSLLDLDAIYAFLSTCYWSPGIARERVERGIANSLCWGAYDPALPRVGAPALPSQVGFARVVTDRASFAYLCDVYVLESHRGRGLSRRMMEAIVTCPELRGVRTFSLKTRDAHGLYAKFGFGPKVDHQNYMEILDRESYKQP